MSVVAISLSFSTHAAIDRWQENKAGGYFVDAYDASIFAHIASAVNGNSNVYFNAGNPECHEFSDSLSSMIIEVNTQKVKASMQCLGEDSAQVWATTKAGMDFVINEFKQKLEVQVKFNEKFTASFSAVGFSKAYAYHSYGKDAI